MHISFQELNEPNAVQHMGSQFAQLSIIEHTSFLRNIKYEQMKPKVNTDHIKQALFITLQAKR